MRFASAVVRPALVVLLLALAGLPAAGPDTTPADEKTLRAAGVGVVGPRLLEFLRGQSPTPPDPRELTALIRQLGADSFQAREKASRRLKALGKAAVPALRR